MNEEKIKLYSINSFKIINGIKQNLIEEEKKLQRKFVLFRNKKVDEEYVLYLCKFLEMCKTICLTYEVQFPENEESLTYSPNWSMVFVGLGLLIDTHRKALDMEFKVCEMNPRDFSIADTDLMKRKGLFIFTEAYFYNVRAEEILRAETPENTKI